MNVLRPTSSPSAFTSGPPLLPGLTAASVWIQTMELPGSACCATALTTPIDTEFRSASGLPKANTSSPCRSAP